MRYTPAQIIGREISNLRNQGYPEESECIQTLRADLKVITDLYLESPGNRIKFPVHLFGRKKMSDSVAELEEAFDLIKSPYTSHLPKNYAYFLNNSIDYLGEYTKDYKRYTPCGLFYTSKDRIDIKKLNGIIMLRTTANRLTDKDKKLITSCPYTFAFYKQLQKDHYILLVRCEGLNNRNYAEFQGIIEKFYVQLIKENKFFAPLINDQVLVSHDIKLYHNPNSLLYKK